VQDHIDVGWVVEDGYAGPEAPQTTKINLSDFEKDMDAEEVYRVLGEFVQEDFEQKITFDIKDREGVVQQILDYLTSLPDEE
jgi:hypothetical protein